MAKNCCICGVKKPAFNSDQSAFVELKDGILCRDCITKMGYADIPLMYERSCETMKKLYEARNPLFKSFSATRDIGLKFRIDDEHKLFMLGQTLFEFDQLESYHVFEDGSTVMSAQHGIRRAVVGHMLFGVGGALVGAGTAKTASSDVCDLLQIRLEVKNYFDKTFDITLAENVSKSSESYKSAVIRLDKYTKAFDSILGIKPEEVLQEPQNTPFSEADEILKFRKLCDAGIITEEEFQAKKKQLLHL